MGVRELFEGLNSIKNHFIAVKARLPETSSATVSETDSAPKKSS
jgi:hypothetical protein